MKCPLTLYKSTDIITKALHLTIKKNRHAQMKFWCYLLLLLPFLTFAQVEPEEQDSTETVIYYYVPGDSIAKSVIELDEVVLLSKLRFSDKDARIKYLILRRKTLKVYPYAKLAAERLTTLNERLESMEKKSDQRKYMRIVQKY